MVKPYEPLYTVKEVSKVLKSNPNFVYNEIKKGKIIALQLGSLRIRGSDLEDYIARAENIDPQTVAGGDANAPN